VIALAQAIDAPALRLRKQHDDIIGALEVSSTEKIAQFRLKLFGAADYPDGTGTSARRVRRGQRLYRPRRGSPTLRRHLQRPILPERTTKARIWCPNAGSTFARS